MILESPGIRVWVLESYGNASSWYDKFFDDLSEYTRQWTNFGYIWYLVDFYEPLAFAAIGTLDAEWHDNLYGVLYQCATKVALTVLKKLVVLHSL